MSSTQQASSRIWAISAVVVTAAPELFDEYRGAGGGPLLVCSTREQGLISLQSSGCRRLFVDLTEIGSTESSGWTGFRFLRQIRGMPSLADVEVWLMASDKGSGQSSWATALGAAGVVYRNPSAVLRVLRAAGGLSERATPEAERRNSFARIEHALLRIAPITGPAIIEGARQAASASAAPIGSLESAQSYAEALAKSVSAGELRDALLREAGLVPSRTASVGAVA